MQHPFDAESPHLGHLTDMVSRAVDVDARLRAIQAERSALLAEAYALAEREGTRSASEPSATLTPVPSPKVPRGAAVRRDRAHRVVRAELAAALNISEWTVSSDISHAVDAAEHCPALLAAQGRGEVTEKHVRGAVDAGRIIGLRANEQIGSTLVDTDGVLLTEEAAQAEVARRYALFDRAVLRHAVSLTPALLVPVAKRIAEKLAGVSFDDRHRITQQDRSVTLTELDDGMCHLTALLTSFEGHAVFDRLTQYAKRLQSDDVIAASKPASDRRASVGTSTPSVMSEVAKSALKRPLPEARADSLVSLLLDGDVAATAGSLGKKIGPRVTARVQVLVPVSMIGRLPATPAGQAGPAVSSNTSDGWFQPELVGVGPIDTDTVARIAYDTPTWDLVVVADGTDTVGEILTVDGYRVPANIRRHLTARDQRCRFIGCGLPSYRCDIDHTIAAEEGGATASDNLAYLCRGHHIMKHHGGCFPQQSDRGELTWTLPSGRKYKTKPPSKVTFSTAIEPADPRRRVTGRATQNPFGCENWGEQKQPDLDPGVGPPPF